MLVVLEAVTHPWLDDPLALLELHGELQQVLEQVLVELVAVVGDDAAEEHAASQVLDSYLLRSLAVSGYAPSFDHCTGCGTEGQHRWFNPAAGGVLCSLCKLPGSAAPAAETLRLLGALLAGEWEVVDPADPRHLREASSLVAAHLHWHLERGLRSFAHLER